MSIAPKQSRLTGWWSASLLPGSGDDVAGAGEVLSAKAAEQFAGVGVDSAVLLGAAGRHVARGERGGPGEQVRGVVLDADRAAGQDEMVRERLDIDGERRARVGPQVARLERAQLIGRASRPGRPAPR